MAGSHAMTKTVSKMTSGGETEDDMLSGLIAAARDNDLTRVQSNATHEMNAIDEEHRTALHWAVDRGHLGGGWSFS